jgi:predicted dehydrogenase
MINDQTIDAAIVGLGWWGRHIVRSLAGSESIRLRHAVDADPGAAAAFAAEHALPLSADLAGALADESIDAVILATPQALHEAQVIASAAAGKHVFCEKPLALTRAGAERAIAACRAAGVVLGIGHERRFEPALTEIKRLADAGELGTLMHVEANYCHDRLTGLDPSNWRAAGAGQPPAGMTGTGVHMTDAFIHMFGEIGQVYALTARRALDWEDGDVVSVLLRFQSGLTGYLNAVMATPRYTRLLVQGSERWAEARNETHPDTAGPVSLTVCRGEEAPETRAYEWVDTVRLNFEAFADAIAGRAAYPFTAAENLHNIAVLEAITRSAASGQAEPIA